MTPDITLCSPTRLKKKCQTCYRRTAKPDERQSYSNFYDECKYWYVPNYKISAKDEPKQPRKSQGKTSRLRGKKWYVPNGSGTSKQQDKLEVGKRLKILKRYWKKYKLVEDEYYGKVARLEKEMEKETRIKGIYFFASDDGICGIGNDDRTMKLIQRRELEK